jgi:hypothetical protein
MADWIEQLERLTQLHKAGALTDEEFAAQKARVLAKADAPDVPAAAAPVTPEVPPEVPGWESITYSEEPARRSGMKWALLALPVALVLAGAAWFGSTLVGGKADPELSGGAIATPVASDAALASAAPSEEAQMPAALDGSLTYANPGECEAGKTLEAIYAKLHSAGDLGSGKGITVTLDAFDTPLGIEAKSSVSADGISTRHAWLRFPAGTTWHGLKLSRLTSTQMTVPDSDGGYERAITFLEQPDKVRTTLARLGFGAPRAPDYAELENDGCGGSMQITAISGGSALTCNWGC